MLSLLISDIMIRTILGLKLRPRDLSFLRPIITVHTGSAPQTLLARQGLTPGPGPTPGQGPQLKSTEIPNAVSLLHQLFPTNGPSYHLAEVEGPPNSPTFRMVCEVQGTHFSGSGPSKKEAKVAASRLALEKLDISVVRMGSVEDPEASGEARNHIRLLMELHPEAVCKVVESDGPGFSATATLGVHSAEGRGLRKKRAREAACEELLNLLHTQEELRLVLEARQNKSSETLEQPGTLVAGRNPVQLLFELHPGAGCEVVKAEGPGFTAVASLGGHKTKEWGRSKKVAKMKASEGLLNLLYSKEGLTAVLRRRDKAVKEKATRWSRSSQEEYTLIPELDVEVDNEMDVAEEVVVEDVDASCSSTKTARDKPKVTPAMWERLLGGQGKQAKLDILRRVIYNLFSDVKYTTTSTSLEHGKEFVSVASLGELSVEVRKGSSNMANLEAYSMLLGQLYNEQELETILAAQELSFKMWKVYKKSGIETLTDEDIKQFISKCHPVSKRHPDFYSKRTDLFCALTLVSQSLETRQSDPHSLLLPLFKVSSENNHIDVVRKALDDPAVSAVVKSSPNLMGIYMVLLLRHGLYLDLLEVFEEQKQLLEHHSWASELAAVAAYSSGQLEVAERVLERRGCLTDTLRVMVLADRDRVGEALVVLRRSCLEGEQKNQAVVAYCAVERLVVAATRSGREEVVGEVMELVDELEETCEVVEEGVKELVMGEVEKLLA